MSKFVARALQKLTKLSNDQVFDLLNMLSARAERLELVLDSMSEGVVVTNDEHQVIIINKSAERLFASTSADQAHEEKIWNIIRYTQIADFVRSALLDQQRLEDREFVVEDGDSHRVFSCGLVPLVREGRIEGSIFSVEDISHRKQREAKLRRYESLASLTTLAAGVAHEIKNPLGSIGIHMQLIEKRLAQLQDVDELQRYASVVNEEVERLNKIVVDFLFAVRPMDIHPVDTDLGEVMGEMLGFVQYELEQGRISLHQCIPNDLPLLQLDERYIKQAVLNIIKNAIAAMPNGGELRVRIDAENEQTVVLSICDTGLGMDESTQNRIFEPYFTTRDYGSGLGLTLVYKIVKEHMGEIQVHSAPGEGSCFMISLPIPQRRRDLLQWKERE